MRETAEATAIFILKSGIKYSHIYLCLFGEHFQYIKQQYYFSSENNDKAFQLFFLLQIFSVLYALYVQNRDKNGIIIQSQRRDTESRVSG